MEQIVDIALQYNVANEYSDDLFVHPIMYARLKLSAEKLSIHLCVPSSSVVTIAPFISTQ